MSLFWHLRIALRGLRRKPGLFLTATAILAAGIGMNTALFSLLQAALFHGAPGVARPGELIRIRRTLKGRTQGNQSYPDYIDLRDGLTTLTGLAAARATAMRLSGPADFVTGGIATPNYFQVLGVEPRLGQLFAPGEQRAVVVLSEALWRSRYGGDAGVVGRALLVNGSPFTIAGVAAAPFRGVDAVEPMALWIPIAMVREGMTRSRDYHWLTERRAGWLTYYGRLHPGVRIEQVQAELDAVGRRLAAVYPETNAERGFRATPHAETTPEQRASLAALFRLLSAASLVVLLIACANIGNLLMARAAAQTRDRTIRVALGASRRDLLWQSLVEASMIGAAGATGGVLVAPWLMPLFQRLIPAPIAAPSLNPAVLASSAVLALVAVAVFGFAASRGTGHGRAMRVWVAAQVALSLALVADAGLALGSMRRILAIDPGYRAANVAVVTTDLSLLGYTPERGTACFLDLIARVSRMPGARSATVAKCSPAVDWSDRLEVAAAGAPDAPVLADRNIIAPGYFETLGIPLLAGRDFWAADRTGARPVAIVSKTLAERLWPDQGALGRQVRLGEVVAEVIGVAADTRYRTVLAAPPPLLYSPLTQNYDSIGRLMVAFAGPAAGFREALRREVQRANAELPIRGAATLAEQIEASLWERSAAASLLSFFGALAIVLACAGIYGVVAYATARQTREIAIRMALGARRSAVLGGVIARTVRLAAFGIVLGLPLAIWSRPALATILDGVRGAEPLAFGGVVLLFLVVAAAAAALPARRAASIDPALALKAE